MNIKNETQVTMFEFSGLTNNKELLPFLFVLIFLVYATTIVGNVGMIALVCFFSSLHTPMYYFLASLSLVDLLYSSVITPNMLTHFLALKKSISFVGCAVQLYLFCALGCTEAVLLSTMSYDRYVAICQPLHYNLIMTKKKCFGLVIYSSSVSFLQSVVQTTCVFSLPFCGSNLIDHFCCDFPPLIRLSCSDSLHCNMVSGVLIATFGVYTLMTIFLSYIFIFLLIFRMTTTKSRQKAFSTCFSHILCVSTYLTAVFFTYLRPYSGTFEIKDKVASVIYITVIPMLNPLIYSLRNQEVKGLLVQATQKLF